MARLVAEQFIGERIADRFVIQRLIDQGALASTFSARDDLLKRRVMVKLFHPQHPDDVGIVDSQLELAKSVARLSNPHIVTVIDRGEHEGMPFIVLENVRGESLQERIERYAPLRIGEVLDYGMRIARALSYAHAQGVVHGNLRPPTVLISEEREVKLIDFGGGPGIASLAEGDPFVPPGGHGGDPQEWHDVYSLGAVLFVALTEETPRANIAAGEVQLLRPDASPRLAAVLARALSCDADHRYRSMHDLASELAGAREHAREPAGEQATEMFQMPMPPANGAAPARSRREPRERPPRSRGRMLAWAMVLVPLVLLLLVVSLVANEFGNEQRVAPKSEKASATEPLELTAVESFDPPPGDDQEADESLPLMIDGDPETGWETEGYADERFGGLKQGVGIYFSLPEPRSVSAIKVVTDLPGWRVQVYGTDRLTPTLSEWTPVSEPTDVTSGKPIMVNAEADGFRHYLMWVTRLSIEDRFRARINELTVQATAE